jgi:uncharacterized tellurite resistance protein B-like protein
MTNRIRAFFEERMRPPAAGNGGSGAGDDADSDGRDEGGEPGAAAGAGAASGPQRPLHLAACALLLELAHADDEFTEAEATHIEVVLRRHFDLDEAEAHELMALAEQERAAAIDLWQFTSLIRASYDLGQKTLLAEIMWGLILADGEIARHEAYLLRKIANLLDLEPGYLSQARKRAAGDEPA